MMPSSSQEKLFPILLLFPTCCCVYYDTHHHACCITNDSSARALSPLPDVRKPPITKAVSSSSAGCTQDYVHREIMVVLCIRVFTLSTGRISYSCDRPSKKLLRKYLAEMGAQCKGCSDSRPHYISHHEYKKRSIRCVGRLDVVVPEVDGQKDCLCLRVQAGRYVVVTVKKESRGLFTLEEVQKNANVASLVWICRRARQRAGIQSGLGRYGLFPQTPILSYDL
ncbi:hypothetical protein AVEN_49353-1 [Araneus ventricosus]|uniref:Uncharacterized protein n=1 Tax=Araneus ventricosus TaxID=182803 RepID=A0A4Y2LPP5_ARAVE|nr:hypothetical protein AVEN_49353-1 [Araneus ventricosus]